ncbi:hypothetical protein V8G54_036887 [Vigna mungo]|uniref:PARG catalytic Macro domain-containing protein n=1 Tax=Vigna mungo TaxID=3915 RepID=A0AAQ3MIH9_VIGMU
MPKGIVLFERKAPHLKNDYTHISCPDANFWSTSTMPLCRFEVHNSRLIEDQSSEAVEVDFANKYLGGGALGRGCLQGMSPTDSATHAQKEGKKAAKLAPPTTNPIPKNLLNLNYETYEDSKLG